MTEMERRIVVALQQELPITAKPYAFVADKLSISENELLCHVRSMLDRGVFRKIGAVLRHRRVGINANALCVWHVPEERIDAVGEMFAALPVVTHCYEREAQADWPYNLYTMVHAATREECEEYIKAMCRMSDVNVFQIIYSTQELKKTSMRYFE